MDTIPGLIYSLNDADIFGQSDKILTAPFTMLIRGSDYEELERIGRRPEIVESTAGVCDVAFSLQPGMPESAGNDRLKLVTWGSLCAGCHDAKVGTDWARCCQVS